MMKRILLYIIAILLLCFFISSSYATVDLIDFYSTSNRDNYIIIDGSVTSAVGQSFTMLSSTHNLTSVIFYMMKTGLPTGSAYAKLYAHSGTYGSSSLPTGAALATSDAFNIATLTTGYVNYTLTFLVQINIRWQQIHIIVLYLMQQDALLVLLNILELV